MTLLDYGLRETMMEVFSAPLCADLRFADAICFAANRSNFTPRVCGVLCSNTMISNGLVFRTHKS